MTWEALVAPTIATVWPDYSSRWLRAQVMVESAGDREAVSPAGAQGLMQIMPATWYEIGDGGDPFDPAENLRRGLTYLRRQYEALPQIPSTDERRLWALACYNGGRGYVNRALRLAYLDGEPLWWHWAKGRHWLMHRACRVGDRHPDHVQIWRYVAKIQEAV